MMAGWLLVVVCAFVGVNAQSITCPRCTDPYNRTSCSAIQDCHDDVCELQVHGGDRNRVEYKCSNARPCSNHEQHGCGHLWDTCTYCCPNFAECLIQLNDLFSTIYTTPLTTSTQSTSDTQTTQSTSGTQTTVASVTYTVADITTVSQRTETTSSGTDTPVATTYETTDAPVRCVECGDFSLGRPCTSAELILNEPTTCPAGLPYCFESVNLVAGSIRVMKGCAENNFCRLEWDISHSVPGCHPLDITIGDIACTYCCYGNLCNAVVPPDPNSQVTFPDDR